MTSGKSQKNLPALNGAYCGLTVTLSKIKLNLAKPELAWAKPNRAMNFTYTGLFPSLFPGLN